MVNENILLEVEDDENSQNRAANLASDVPIWTDRPRAMTDLKKKCSKILDALKLYNPSSPKHPLESVAGSAQDKFMISYTYAAIMFDRIHETLIQGLGKLSQAMDANGSVDITCAQSAPNSPPPSSVSSRMSSGGPEAEEIEALLFPYYNQASFHSSYEWQVKLYDLLPQVNLKETMDVWGSYYYTANELYVQYDQKQAAKVDFFLNESCEIIAKNPDLKLNKRDIKIGSVVAAKFSGDNKWYRAMVMTMENNLYNVYYFDYGNSGDVKFEDLLPLPKCVENYSIQAIKCIIHGYYEHGLEAYEGDIKDKISASTCFIGTKFEVSFTKIHEEAQHPDVHPFRLMQIPYYEIVLFREGFDLISAFYSPAEVFRLNDDDSCS